MKNQLQTSIKAALKRLFEQGHFTAPLTQLPIRINHTRDKRFGDLSSNIAMLAVKPLRLPPMKIAEYIVNELGAIDGIDRIEVAKPGFINFFLSNESNTIVIKTILDNPEQFGQSDSGQDQRIHIEYVSANPTGPLHVGHGRGASYGATLANILKTAGFDVHREYYVNDAGRQMDILAVSVWCRYLQRCGEDFPLPAKGYQGDYIKTIADTLFQKYDQQLCVDTNTLTTQLPDDNTTDLYLDQLITIAKSSLNDQYQPMHRLSHQTLLHDIRDDLSEFGVEFDQWFSEKSLTDDNLIQQSIEQLIKTGYTYEKEGALWFKSTAFDDDKDRVLIRDNGQSTYFASDVAYQMNKYDRGFDMVINVFGADHHGYVQRLKAFLAALGKHQDDKFLVPLVQFAILWKDGEKVSMSTRSGEYVTLRQLRHDIGNDAARFFYVMRKHEQHMDFDLTLATSESNDNPMYYIQYAYARICSIFRQLTEKQLSFDQGQGLAHLSQLTHESEQAIITQLSRYPELIIHSAKTLKAHGIAHYLRELAGQFHSYYNSQQILVDNADLRQARLCLLQAIQTVIRNGLTVLGVSAPETM